ncbi:MAG: RluA family pseudouridine synthase [Anaeroplasma sp.]|nr:RluA family pseudouridine synthase [Anaeroplasma sp.]
MKTTIIDFICENEKIELRNELKQHISKKFYKNLKSSNTPIYVNGKILLGYELIHKGDHIRVEYERNEKINWPLYESSIDIVFENDNYLVVNKRSGLLSIPTKSEPFSLYQEVLYYLKKTKQNMSVSILNRLDKETKGLVVIAKNRLASYYLSPTHEKMIRKYECLCEGIFEEESGKIITYIDKNEDSNKRFVSDNTGKLAVSNYKVLKYYEDKTLVEFVLETGRTHQIRVHTSYLGHPIIGDKMYGNSSNINLCLCSVYVSFYDQFEKRQIELRIGSDY